MEARNGIIPFHDFSLEPEWNGPLVVTPAGYNICTIYRSIYRCIFDIFDDRLTFPHLMLDQNTSSLRKSPVNNDSARSSIMTKFQLLMEIRRPEGALIWPQMRFSCCGASYISWFEINCDTVLVPTYIWEFTIYRYIGFWKTLREPT